MNTVFIVKVNFHLFKSFKFLRPLFSRNILFNHTTICAFSGICSHNAAKPASVSLHRLTASYYSVNNSLLSTFANYANLRRFSDVI